MDFLFVRHDLGLNFEEIHLFSDGCGKHFKTYPTHWYLADLKQRLVKKKTDYYNNNINNNNNNSSNMEVEPFLRIHWDYLPPGDAHNRCDGAAAHWKRPQKKLIRDFAVLTTVGHLAFACASLKNCYLIEAECTKFPDPLACLIDEPWMQESFHFDYGVPFTDTRYCAHQNKLKYACCKKTPKLLPCVTVLVADREHNLSQHVLWLDEEQKHDDELDSLDETEFWSSPSRRRYHSITGPRVSQLSAASRNIYEYENKDDVFDDSSDSQDSGDDFVDD
jgi:hypothetical protein